MKSVVGVTRGLAEFGRVRPLLGIADELLDRDGTRLAHFGAVRDKKERSCAFCLRCQE